ncbi:MAG: hypothetical protein R2822_25345 [Spirosomataceae bacterium]
MKKLYFLCLLAMMVSVSFAQSPDVAERIKALEDRLQFLDQGLGKTIDDLLWYQKVGDVAIIDKVRYTSKPPHVVKNPTGQGATIPSLFLPIPLYPKNLPRLKNYHSWC